MVTEDPRKPWGERLAEAVNRRTVIGQTEKTIPTGLRVATAYAWRLLVIAGALAVVIWLIIQLKLLVVPLLVAILVTALLWPVFTWMLRHRVPRWLAIVISVIGTIAIVTGLLWLAVWQITQQWPRVRLHGMRTAAPRGVRHQHSTRCYAGSLPLRRSSGRWSQRC